MTESADGATPRVSYLDIPAVLVAIKTALPDVWADYFVKIEDPFADAPEEHWNAFLGVIDAVTDVPSECQRTNLLALVVFLHRNGRLPPSAIEMLALPESKDIDHKDTEAVVTAIARDIPDAWNMHCEHLRTGEDFHEEFEVINPYTVKRTNLSDAMEMIDLMGRITSYARELTNLSEPRG